VAAKDETRTGDELIDEAQDAEEERGGSRDERAANLFDIRRIIGGLFLVYGVIMIVTGIVGDHAVKTKASGINVDLITGICMVVFAILMIAWALLRPTRPEPPETRGQGSGRIRRAPAT
jgi:F0F1-type ATP synthase assembly protein I